jgi:hypothetical protein
MSDAKKQKALHDALDDFSRSLQGKPPRATKGQKAFAGGCLGILILAKLAFCSLVVWGLIELILFLTRH